MKRCWMKDVDQDDTSNREENIRAAVFIVLKSRYLCQYKPQSTQVKRKERPFVNVGLQDLFRHGIGSRLSIATISIKVLLSCVARLFVLRAQFCPCTVLP